MRKFRQILNTAIAQAILKNPPLLILDEATAAVDNETEAAIQKSLQVITQNRTTIVIAHGIYTKLWYAQSGIRDLPLIQ